MSRHVTYRGTTVDMDSMRLNNGDIVAIGNMRTNARGDQLGTNNSVTKTADQIARERHRTVAAVTSGSIKGPMPDESDINTVATRANPVKPTVVKPTETQLPSGDIVVE